MLYLLLGLAIVAEVIGTSALIRTEGFSRLWPSLVVFVSYGLAFYLLSLVVRHMPTGVMYAVWSGAGIVLVAIVGWAWLGQKLDAPAIIGMGLIIAGVLVINLFSGSISH